MSAARRVTLDITGMHCAACGLLVDDCMEDVAGVVASQTDVRSGVCVAEVGADVADAALVAAVAEAGYAATVRPPG